MISSYLHILILASISSFVKLEDLHPGTETVLPLRREHVMMWAEEKGRDGMEQGEEKRLAALDRVNGAACLLVILIHVLSLGISNLQADSWQLFVVFMPWRLSSFVVPLFLFSGAVKQVMHFSEKPLTLAAYASYLKGRFFRVLLPYMMWVAVYYAYCYRIGFVKGSVEEFLGYLRLGNLSSHFYYIIIVLQFYLLLPLWMWMVKRIPAYAALCGAALVTIFMLSFLGLLHLFGASMAYVDRLFLSYLFFWVLGLYAGRQACGGGFGRP